MKAENDQKKSLYRDLIQLMDKDAFIRRVKSLMKRENLKPKELMDRSGYAKATYYKHMNFDSPVKPGIDDIIRLSYFLNTSIDYLVRGKGAIEVNHAESDKFFDLVEAMYHTEREAYGILFNIILKLTYTEVEVAADMALAYAESRGL